MAIAIINCQCKNSYQDQIYGSGMRVGNITRNGQIRCTVCGTVHGSQGTTQSDKVAARVAAKETTKGSKDKKVEKPKKKRSLKGGKR